MGGKWGMGYALSLFTEPGGVELVRRVGRFQLVFVDLLAVRDENLAELGVVTDGRCVFVVELDDETRGLREKGG